MNKQRQTLQIFKTTLILLIIVLTSININLNAQTPGTNRWFINKNATGSNNGTSWENAWTSSSNISWSQLQPGSIIYISGGTDSLVYNMSIAIPQGKNGITITKGLSSGHNGKVIFDSDWSASKAISIDGNGALTQNITIKNITIRDYTSYGIYGDGQNSGGLQHILIDSVRVESHRRAGIFFEGNGNVANNFDITISNCYVNDDDINTSQCDNIYLQYLESVRVSKCTLIADNPYNNPGTDLHSDNIQTFWCNDVIYDNNVVVMKNATKVLGTQMLFTAEAESGSKHIFYNNVLYRDCPNATDKALRTKMNDGKHLYIINNSFIGYGNVQSHDITSNAYMYNNIFYGLDANGTGSFSVGTATRSNNIVYDPTNSYNNMSGSIEANPLFANTNYSAFDLHLQEGSPAINAGYNAQSIIEGFGLEWKDLEGNVRDSSPDIGAYEFATGNNTDITPPQVVSASLTNSTTLVISFSETLNSSTAQNINNYSISNGINIVSANLSSSTVTLTTSAHSSGDYSVTVNNVTDLAGNVINPNNNSANYSYSAGDVTPPGLQGAVLNNATSLTLNFSEPLSSATAQNIANYSINNGINVTDASLSGSQVTLTTSTHTSGNYTVTVNNITDLAGNVINPNSNSANYSYTAGDVTPPQVVSAAIIDSVKLNVFFSENLNPSTAQNINNYSINNGISILSATSSGSLVTLTTTEHSAGNYLVTVNNVTDITGNVIDSQNNTAIYEYVVISDSSYIELPINSVLPSVVPELEHGAEKTLDGKGYFEGDPDSRWAGDTMPEWLVYDFGNVQTLNQTRLSFYNWNSGRIYNYTLQVSTDSLNWNEIRTNIPSVAEEWSIENVEPIETRYVKIIFISNNQSAWAGLWEAEFWGNLKIPVSAEDDDKKVPNSFSLEQNYPNPFNPSTIIKYSINNNQFVSIKVYDILGNEVETLVNGQKTQGTHEVEFKAENLSSGVYIYRLQTSDFIDTKKMVLLR